MTAFEIKIGDHPTLVLTKDVAKSLGLREGQNLNAERQQDGSLKIGPYDPKFDKAMRIAKDVMVEYAERSRRSPRADEAAYRRLSLSPVTFTT